VGQTAVRLGDVRVFDARGAALPARMLVTASETRFVVVGRALAGARYPVTIDPEIGANDIRISDMGTDLEFDAFEPDVAYNAAQDEYFVVWSGDDSTGSLANDEYEIFGQRVSAAGAEIGTDLRLSDMGPDGDRDYPAFGPALAANPARRAYLVVWAGEDEAIGLLKNELEIFGQRLSVACELYLPLLTR
jgi:hypothetical protein